jgi:hypothetical protein
MENHKMTFPYRSQACNAFILTGMVFVMFASIAIRFLHPSAKFPESLTDGFIGLLYGIAIGCMLVGVRRNYRRRSAADDGAGV